MLDLASTLGQELKDRASPLEFNDDPILNEMWQSIKNDKHSDKILLMDEEDLVGL
jgi:hypothetical protein